MSRGRSSRGRSAAPRNEPAPTRAEFGHRAPRLDEDEGCRPRARRRATRDGRTGPGRARGRKRVMSTNVSLRPRVCRRVTTPSPRTSSPRICEAAGGWEGWGERRRAAERLREREDGAAKRASRGRASGSRTSSGSPLYAAGSGSASAANGASLPRARRARSASSSAPRRASRRGESARRPPPSPRTRPSRRDARATTRATTRGSATRAANVAARPIAIHHLAGSRARDRCIVYPLRDPYTRRVSSNDGSDGIGYMTHAPSSRAKHRALLRERLLVRALHHIRHVFPRRVSRQPLPVPVRERHPSRRSGRRRRIRRGRRSVAAKAPAPRRRTVAPHNRRRHSRGHRGLWRHVRMIRPNGRRRRRACLDVDGRVRRAACRSSPSPARRIPSSRLRVAFARRRPPLPSREIASATARVSTRRPSSASRARLRDLAPAWVRTTGT